MNNIKKIDLKDKIYNINGIDVMLDSDLAELYGVETKRINEAVKNNPLKFPDRYSWVLKNDEIDQFSLRSKFSTLNVSENRRGLHTKYNPRVFTEQGIYMLATILKSDIATKVTINIMDTFVSMRKYISNEYIREKLLLDHEERLLHLEEVFKELNKNKKDEMVFFDGQFYDSYSKVIDILSEANENLIIIDGYADKALLDIFSNINVNITLITKDNKMLSEKLLDNYYKQYNNLKIIYNDTFHDRYFILDNKIIYHCGASVNKIGTRTFSINKINDNKIIQVLLKRIYKIID